jgi:hypothetical protein
VQRRHGALQLVQHFAAHPHLPLRFVGVFLLSDLSFPPFPFGLVLLLTFVKLARLLGWGLLFLTAKGHLRITGAYLIFLSPWCAPAFVSLILLFLDFDFTFSCCWDIPSDDFYEHLEKR